MERLECHVKEYQWGKKGAKSEVAALFAAGHKDFRIGKDTPYAELWMGTHPDGPARLAGSSVKLSSYIAQSESGRLLSNNNSNARIQAIHLPFIMKVMSIEHTLSLQVHPTKEQAVRLHARDPINYPDEHHKPELAYALTTFELLCGFRPGKELIANIDAFPSLRVLFGESNCDVLRNFIGAGYEQKSLKCRIALAVMFRHMLEVPQDELRELLLQLLNQLDRGVRGVLNEGTVAVVKKMAMDFPGDVGIFSPLFLNHMVLQPGECCYYAAEELHAYLSGECVECVGCSNNTIRAAMTSKYIDRSALVEVLNYQMTPPEEYLVPGVALEDYPHVDEYAPDCKDFQLHRIRASAGSSNLPLPVLDCASIVVFVAGEGSMAEMDEDNQEISRRSVQRGDIIYIAPGMSIKISECTADMDAYRTFSFEMGPDHENRPSLKRSLANAVDTCIAPKIITKPKFALNFEPVFNPEADMDGMA